MATGYTTSAVATAVYAINNSVPVISSLSPAANSAGGTAFTLTVNGSGFSLSSTVYWGTSALATQYGDSSQLTAQVTAADIATAGITGITVQTPAPGGELAERLGSRWILPDPAVSYLLPLRLP